MDTMDRTAAERPAILGRLPYLVSSTDVIFQHEVGTDDNVSAMAFQLNTPFFNSGSLKADLNGFAPDSIQTGNINVNLVVQNYPQGVSSTKGSYLVTPTSNNFTFETAARFWQYQITGSAVGQSWMSGYWQEMLSKGSPQ